MKNLAVISGIKGLFPTFFNDFLRNILNHNVMNPYLIKGHNYENIEDRVEEFQEIECAIKEFSIIELVYRDKKRKVYSYKFANVKGI